METDEEDDLFLWLRLLRVARLDLERLCLRSSPDDDEESVSDKESDGLGSEGSRSTICSPLDFLERPFRVESV